MQKSLFLLLFSVVPLGLGLQGCIIVPAAIGGALITQDVLEDNVYVGRIDADASRTWTTTKVSLGKSSLKPIDIDDEARKAVGEVDGANVTCTVETYDLHQSILRVSAKKYGVANGQIAKLVFDKILADLGKN